MTQNEDQREPLITTPLCAPEVSGEVHNAINAEHSEQKQPKDVFSEEEIEEMKLVFESSPQKAQRIVKYLQDPTRFPDSVDYRSAYFVGEPGSGKTMMAKAIAYKMSQEGWEYRFILSSSLLGKYRNQTAVRLQEELENIEISNKPTILIIDELHRLLENMNSKHHDTDTTATTLWTFLDKQAGNKNFFLIGTMNRIDRLPKPFKSRMLPDYIRFPLMIDSTWKKKLLRKNLTTTSTRLDEEVTDAFLDTELEKIGPCSGRDLKQISRDILMMHETNKEKTPLIIKKESITTAFREHGQQKEECKYELEEETDEERQERHHKENMNLQEQHFVQQQKLQAFFICYQNKIGKSLLPDCHTFYDEIKDFLSDEQKKLYNNINNVRKLK